MRVVAAASLLPLIAVGTPTGIQGVARVTVEDETLMHRNRGVWPTMLLGLMDRYVLIGLFGGHVASMSVEGVRDAHAPKPRCMAFCSQS